MTPDRDTLRTVFGLYVARELLGWDVLPLTANCGARIQRPDGRVEYAANGVDLFGRMRAVLAQTLKGRQ